MAVRTKRLSNQEIMLFEGGRKLPEGFDARRARQAAMRRSKRLGQVQRTSGFLRRVDGLFVPHSGTENSAVVLMPEVKAEQDTKAAVQRVHDKYEDSDVPTSRVNLWAHFAGQRAHAELRRHYRGFMNESGTNAARIALRLQDFDGRICREAFTYDPQYRLNPDGHGARQDVLAYNSVLKYFVDLETFVGLNPDVIGKSGQRKWPQFRHEKNYRARMERVHQELDPLAEDLFADRVEEAYWSHFSRNRFWIEVNNSHLEYLRNNRFNVPVAILPPVEIYEGLIEDGA